MVPPGHAELRRRPSSCEAMRRLVFVPIVIGMLFVVMASLLASGDALGRIFR